MAYRHVSLLVLTLLAQAAFAKNDIEPGKEFYDVIYAPNPIKLDGDLSEWTGVPVLADPKFAVPKGSGSNASPNYVLFEEYAGGTWSGPDDQTSAVQIVYDNDNVYFGFVVTDDYHENSANSAWNGDSVQLMIADATRTQQIALYNYALGGVEGAIGDVIVMHEAGPATDEACNCATEAVIKRDAVKHKTTYEIKLPKAALGLDSLKGGPQFGLGMAINDGDSGPGQAGQKGWGGLGAHSIVFGKTPSETALITLRKGNDIEPGKEYYTALKTTKTITIDGNLGEWSGAPVLADPKFAVPKFSGTNASPNYVLFEEYAGGTWSGPDDQTSAVQVVYDDNNVYFGFVVTDDYHENSANSAWNGDSVQLMIADATRTQQIALYNYALGGVEGALGDVIVMHEAGPATDDACNCATEAVVKRDAAAKKTYYEIKLPAASLGMTPPLTIGSKFGLGMAINDGDSGPGQAGQKGWGGLGAHSIVFGKTPQETAEVTLGTTVSGGDVMFLSAVNGSVSGFNFRANDKGASICDPTTAKLTIDGAPAALTNKKTGDATDFTHVFTTAIALDTQHTYAIEVKDTLGNKVTDAGNFKIGSFKIGINFGVPGADDQPNDLPSALAGTDVAGVPEVAQGYWNNITGANLTNTDPDGNLVPVVLLSDQGANAYTTVTVAWESNNTWASTGVGEENNQFPEGPDKVLMTGYLDTGDATTTKVKLSGIPSAFTAGNGYDVYVYALGGVAGRGGGYRIVSTNGAVLKDYVLYTTPTNPTVYKEVAPATPTARAAGTYIVFKNLHASDIVLEATAAAPQGSGSPPRAPVNAIQLMPSKSSGSGGGSFTSVTKSGNNIVLAWTGGSLETADAVTGPWTASAATSPATFPITGAKKFFRVK